MGVDKKTIHPGLLDGTMQHQHNAIKFPPTRKPTFLAWREWKAFIFRNFLSGKYIITPPIYMHQYVTQPTVPKT